MSSPTQRTLAWCRQHGMTAQVVEKWNPHARIRQDLFGCIDIVACGGHPAWIKDGVASERMRPRGIWGIQACAGSSASARVKKAIEQPGLRAWLGAGGLFVVMAWRKQGPRGKAKTWQPRFIDVQLIDGELFTSEFFVAEYQSE